MSKILVLGGVKSGKSRWALQHAQGHERVFIATARAFDGEMEEKIRRHREERDESWRTLESPIDLASAIGSLPNTSSAVVDCITVWLGNVFHEEGNGDPQGRQDSLLEATKRCGTRQMILISNEIGLGLIGATADTRHYVNQLGILNQRLAAACDEVVLMVAGQCVRVKP